MPAMFARIGKAWKDYRRLRGWRRELTTLGIGLAFGLVLLPPLIYLMGRQFLGDYVRTPAGSPTGGIFAFWLDYLRGIFTGSPGYWVALLGPYVLLKWLRISGALLRR